MAVAGVSDLWERRLKREGLGPLDGPTGIVSSRGAGKSKAGGRAEELARRRALLDNYVFPSRHREIYIRWAEGETASAIAARFRLSRWPILRSIRRTERDYAAQRSGRKATPIRSRHHLLTPAEQIARFARESDPSLVALAVSLIRRAVISPEEMLALADQVEAALP